ncbi:uncharacterized protein LOC113278757 [Papaver somniferum]|uniref:uncharacterized protein LOC113278757 n=1 Tax=Papaver somniferum TaxID=3469 RepID=UPI000E6F8879|nr:uncharacterized protein LOC113278757 [Papaver somniferum]
MAKSFQEKYFPTGDIFEAKQKYNSTWSWRSISSEVGFIQRYSCWNVGDGKDILIWKHRWIPELQDPPKPKHGCLIHDQFIYVNQLFLRNTSSWDIYLLHTLFDTNIVSFITSLSIHLSQVDNLIWLLEKNENFTVKSCYRKMYEETHPYQSVGPRMQNIYKRLWKLPTLPRVCQFLWKATSNLLATREALGHPIVGSDDSCPFCGQHQETASHV